MDVGGGSKLITKNSISCNSFLNTTLESLNQNVKQFWQIDSYGTVPESQLISANEKRSLELLEKKQNFLNWSIMEKRFSHTAKQPRTCYPTLQIS